MDSIDALDVVEPVLVLDPSAQLDDALILRMQYDLATGMHNGEVIARRYGMRDGEELREYLRAHPAIVQEARKMRAEFQSDAASEGRVRSKFLRAAEQLIIPIAALVADPRTPIASRIDGFKQIQRGAGVDGAPAAAAKHEKAAGAAFNLTINFAGGRAQRIDGTTVVDADDIPPPSRQLMQLTPDEEDARPEEDV